MSYETRINLDQLRSLREQLGVPVEEVAAGIGLRDGKRSSAAEKYEAIELGEKPVTWNVLKRMSSFYRTPVATFFLRYVPEDSRELADFRTVADRPATMQRWLQSLINIMKARQSELREILLEDIEESVSFVSSINEKDGPERCAAKIRDWMDFPFSLQKECKNYEELFRSLRHLIEGNGIFVYLSGDLGSWHTKIDVETFRGFCLEDKIAPIIVINNNDAKSAWNFTLIHELCHLALGQSSISNSNPFDTNKRIDKTEEFCNAVSAHFLLPRDEFLEAWEATEGASLALKIEKIAGNFNVSRAFTARRAFASGLITEKSWWGLYKVYQKEWHQKKARLKEKDGGPGYYLLKRSQIGDRTIKTVLSAVNSGNLSDARASRILGVKAGNFERLRKEAQ